MAKQPTTVDLQLLIQTLQGQVQALQAAQQAAPNVGTAPPVAPIVTFTTTPQALNAKDLIDYSTKQGSAIFEQGCKALDNKALTDGFALMPDQTIIFVEAFYRRAVSMGWTQGTKQIMTFANNAGVSFNIIKCYGQISKGALKMGWECFCKAGEADAQTRAAQNNMMMATCLAKSLTADTQARLLTNRSKYTFDCVEYAPPHVQGHCEACNHRHSRNCIDSLRQSAKPRSICSDCEWRYQQNSWQVR
jgi:hypothetical protein